MLRRFRDGALGALVPFCALMAVSSAPPPADRPAPAPSPDRVLARLGVPHGFEIAGSTYAFVYDGADGRSARAVFHGEVAVTLPPDGFRPAGTEPASAERLHTGQRLADAMAHLTRPITFEHGADTTIVRTSAGIECVLAHGRVFVRRPDD